MNMKKLIKFGVAGALVAGCVTAQAQNGIPSSNTSDLWLFVSDATAQTTFAEDTGISINSLAPSASFNAAGVATVLSTKIGANINFGPSTALTAYINAANTAGHVLQWAVQAMQYNGSPTSNANPGGAVGITANVASSAGNTSQLVFNPNQTTWANGWNNDEFYLCPAGFCVNGGASFAWSAGSVAGQGWEPGTSGGNGGSADLYGQGPDTSGNHLGASLNLYALTGNGGAGQVQSYVLANNLTLSATGQLTASPAVPLPAAVWLFGSGLLGLLGVGRRRAATA